MAASDRQRLSGRPPTQGRSADATRAAAACSGRVARCAGRAVPRRSTPKAGAAARRDPAADARRDFASTELAASCVAQGYDRRPVADAVARARRGAPARRRPLRRRTSSPGTPAAARARRASARTWRRPGCRPTLIAGALRGRPGLRGAAGAQTSAAAASAPNCPPTGRRRARQARFLQYRGFSSDHIPVLSAFERDLIFEPGRP